MSVDSALALTDSVYERFRVMTPDMFIRPRLPGAAERAAIQAPKLHRYILHRLGWTDAEIAYADGVAPTTVANWRVRRGLPLNRSKRTSPVPRSQIQAECDAARMALYEQGLSDADIAERCGTSPQVIMRWRRYRKLRTNHRKPRARRTTPRRRNTRPANSWAIRALLYEQGLTDVEIARAEAIARPDAPTPQAIRDWRRKQNLPRNPRRKKIP